MTASPTKASPSRINGAGVPIGGPAPAPRVVGNRRIRAGGIVLAAMLLLFGAALSGIALISVSKSSSYLAVAKTVQAGSPITADELKSVQIAGGAGLTLIPAVDLSEVVGRRATATLVPGMLLSPAQFTNQAALGAGETEVPISLNASRLPTAHLTTGTQIVCFPLAATSPRAAPHLYTVNIVDIGTPGSDGSITLWVATNVQDVPAITSANNNGGLGCYVAGS